MPLDRALSKLGRASRTEARRLIRGGRVSLDGRVVSDPARLVSPERTAIAVDGVPVDRAEPVVVLFHKPRGTVTTARDPAGRPTIRDLLQGLDVHVSAVGRLDRASSGLLLLTNDTRLAHWLTDPAQRVPRRYVVTVRGSVTDDAAATLAAGVEDRGEWLTASSVTLLKRSRRETHLIVELTEGKNREIRRLFAAVGHEVTRLLRVAYGGLELGRLPAGRWRLVPTDELRQAFPGWARAQRR